MKQCSNFCSPLTILSLLLHQSWSSLYLITVVYFPHYSASSLFPAVRLIFLLTTLLKCYGDVRRAIKKILEANTISLTLHPWLLTLFLFCEFWTTCTKCMSWWLVTLKKWLYKNGTNKMSCKYFINSSKNLQYFFLELPHFKNW